MERISTFNIVRNITRYMYSVHLCHLPLYHQKQNFYTKLGLHYTYEVLVLAIRCVVYHVYKAPELRGWGGRPHFRYIKTTAVRWQRANCWLLDPFGFHTVYHFQAARSGRRVGVRHCLCILQQNIYSRGLPENHFRTWPTKCTNPSL